MKSLSLPLAFANLLVLGSAAVTNSTSARTTPTSRPTLTTKAPSTTDFGTCSPVCYQTNPSARRFTWQTLNITATITAATVKVIVNKDANTTRTTTIFADLPSGVKMPPTNSAGTQTHVVTGFDNKTTAVAFPTEWEDYDTLMSWSGVLPTKGTCTSASKAIVTLPDHPRPVLTEAPTITDAVDKGGLLYTAMGADYHGDDKFINSALEGEAFRKLCSQSFVAPVVALSGVKFLTDTSTEFESGKATPTPAPEPPKSTALPQSQPAPPPANTPNPPANTPNPPANTPNNPPVNTPNNPPANTPNPQPNPQPNPPASSDNGIGALISVIASVQNPQNTAPAQNPQPGQPQPQPQPQQPAQSNPSNPQPGQSQPGQNPQPVPSVVVSPNPSNNNNNPANPNPAPAQNTPVSSVTTNIIQTITFTSANGQTGVSTTNVQTVLPVFNSPGPVAPVAQPSPGSPNQPGQPQASGAQAPAAGSITTVVPQVVTSTGAGGSQVLVTNLVSTVLPARPSSSSITALVPTVITTTNSAGSTSVYTSLVQTVLPVGQPSASGNAAGSGSGSGSKTVGGSASATQAGATGLFTGAASAVEGWKWGWSLSGLMGWVVMMM